MEEPLADLAILEDSNIQDKQEKPLQKLKIKKGEKPVMEDAVINETPKQKRERSEKQIETTKKMIEKRNANILVAKEKKAQEDMIRKKEIEEKIVKKAVAIKKREIKQKAILEEISDDDTPIEEIKKIASKVQVKKVAESGATVGKALEPEKPKTIFEKYKFI
jgi:type II secretory pathway component PulC